MDNRARYFQDKSDLVLAISNDAKYLSSSKSMFEAAKQYEALY